MERKLKRIRCDFPGAKCRDEATHIVYRKQKVDGLLSLLGPQVVCDAHLKSYLLERKPGTPVYYSLSYFGEEDIRVRRHIGFLVTPKGKFKNDFCLDTYNTPRGLRWKRRLWEIRYTIMGNSNRYQRKIFKGEPPDPVSILTNLHTFDENLDKSTHFSENPDKCRH